MADLRRTVLLARPGEARERLRAALEAGGVEVVLEADPLEIGIDQVRGAEARNVVIAVDAEVEDALDRFDAILADDQYQILFEETALVNARDGWDAARWSRHLGAKLLGHGDVLPEGHESDEESAGMLADITSTELIENDVIEGDVVEDGEAESFGIQLEDTSDEVMPEDQPDPSSNTTHDWSRFQDFEAVNELPAANAPQATETDFRAAFAPLDKNELPDEQIYEQLEQEIAQFDAAGPSDRWQDFDKPAVEQDKADEAAVVQAPPPDASSWSLTDEPLTAANPKTTTSADGLAGLSERIAKLSLVDEEAHDAESSDGQDAWPVEGAGDEAPATLTSEGAVLLVGGIGGPDPLRQILQQLGKGFSVPVLVQQWLDGGQYDRLVRQMDRASQMPVLLAEAGQPLLAGRVYIVPTAITVQRVGTDALRFIDAATRGFADVLSALPPGSSGAVLLSGTREDFVEPALRFLQAGGHLFAQSADACYDHAVPALLIQRGAEANSPVGIATQLAARWQQQVSA